MADLLYVVEKECPLCEKTFKTTRVRNNLRLIRQDTDFCSYYEGVNPYYYTVWVCPHCGYAAQDTFFNEPLPAIAAEKLKRFLSSRQVNVDFGGIRTCEQAIATYKLAIFYAEMNVTLPSRIAGLWLKLGWLYRETGHTAEEQISLTKAVEYYEQAPLKERFPIGNLTEVALQYLTGELYRRTGKMEEAVSYLGRLISDPRARAEKRVYEMAREVWQLARSEIKDKAAESEQKAD